MTSKKQQQRQQTQLLSSSRKPTQLLKPKNQETQLNPSLYLTREINQADVYLIKQAFDQHDSNGHGLLTPNDLKLALFNMNFYANKETIYNLIAEYDEQGLGGLTFDAFIRVLSSNPAQVQTSNDLKKLFRKYDRENKGFINAADLYAAAKSLGQPMSEEQSLQLFRSLDQKNRGKIQFEQFCLLMHHPNSLN